MRAVAHLILENFLDGVRSMNGVSPIFWWLMALKFLESFTYFALSQVLVIYLHSELGCTDLEAGTVYGIWGSCITFFSLILSCVNDSLGVRRALMVGFVCEVIGNVILALARTKTLAFALLFSVLPIGSCLGIPMLTIGVKRLTNNKNRGFAFGIFYTTMNFGALAAGPIVDLLNLGELPGTPLSPHAPWLTGNRAVLLTCALSALISLIITVACLAVPTETLSTDVSLSSSHSTDELVQTSSLQMSPLQSGSGQSVDDVDSPELEEGVEEDRGQVEEERRDDALEGRVVTWAMVRELVGTKRFWRYCALSLCLVNLRAIFRHLDATFPTYLLREHGQGVPKGIIYSINPAIIIIFTPLIAASTTKIAHFDMIKWGSWFSGLAALPLVLSSTVWAAVLFVVLLSLGEAIWSPSTYNYAMSIAPHGREATFSALATAPLFAAKIPVGLLGGYLLQTYMPEGDEHDQQPHMLWLIIGSLTMSSVIMINAFEPCIRQPDVPESTAEKRLDDDGDYEGTGGQNDMFLLHHERGANRHLRLRTDSGHDSDDVETVSG